MNKALDSINNKCLVILTAIALTGALIYTRTILVPFVISIFIYVIASPAVHFFQHKCKLPRAMAVSSVIAVFLICSFVLITFMTTSLESFINGADIYRVKMITFIQTTTEFLSDKGIVIDSTSVKKELMEMPIFSMAQKLTGGLMSFLSNTILIIIFALFLIAGERSCHTTESLIGRIQWKISKYVGTKFLTSLATGILVGVVLGLLNVELAFMFALLTILFNFIPSVGSIIATILPLPVVFLQFGFNWQFYIVLVLCGSIQFLIGNVLEPKIMGENMDLHPVTILLFLMFWGLVWGLPGMFLAVPITAILKIVLERIETTKPLAELLSGKIPSSWSPQE